MNADADAGRAVANAALVPAHAARWSGRAVPVGAARSPGQSGPQVELVREGDVIREIDIRCPCGQHLRLRCLYGAER